MLRDEELVFTISDDGKNYGVRVDSLLNRNNGNSKTKTNEFNGGGSNKKVSSLFDTLAVPVTLLHISKMGGDVGGGYGKNRIEEINNDEVISGDIYEKLLKMMEIDEPMRKTSRKNRKLENKQKTNIKVSRKNRKNSH